VLGATGMLGHDMTSFLRERGTEVLGFGRADVDIRDKAAVESALRETRPAVVVNCAAWTAVDDAESQEAEALEVNGRGAANVAAACAAVEARLMQPSTDYVFSGDGDEPYAEYAAPAPCTAYGRTKLAGERAVINQLPRAGYVLRTAWLYGEHGPNFVRAMIRLESERESVAVVDDQRGQPTWTSDLARQIFLLAESGAEPGIYHATSQGATTWLGLAREIFRLLGADPERVRPTTTRELARAAPRPAYSVLGHSRWARAGLPPLPHWTDSLVAAFPAMSAAAGRELDGSGAPTRSG
jgi:dTDP-4-dehydrorhamnose reductase